MASILFSWIAFFWNLAAMLLYTHAAPWRGLVGKELMCLASVNELGQKHP